MRRLLLVLYVLLVLVTTLVMIVYIHIVHFGFRLNVAYTSYYSQQSNYQYVHNRNLMQYSSYVIVVSESVLEIHAFAQFNHKYQKTYENKTDFRCLLSTAENNEIIELEVYETPKMYWSQNKKFICKYPVIGGKISGVAVVRLKDYYKANSSTGDIQFDLINFQTPTIIYPQEPRRASVGLCVHYTYHIPTQLINWLDMHLEFGYAEIVIYDATNDQSLAQLVKQKYSDDHRVIVRSYAVNKENLCDERLINKACSNGKCSVESVLKSCHDFYDHEFRDKYNWRNKHEQLTSNDCFTQLSYKHEFVAYYDLDEFVYPRNEEANRPPRCDDYNRICSSRPFTHIYSYLKYILKTYGNGRDVSKLGSILFDHAAYLIPNHVEKSLMHDLASINDSTINNRTSSSLFLSEPPFDRGHLFTIDYTDVDYIKQLVKTYYSIIPCVYHAHLKHITKLDSSLLRHLYYLTEPNERMGKSIHYSKNVKSIFTHYALESKVDTWSMSAPSFKGHLLSHYRRDVSAIYRKNFTNSIRKLSVDLDYTIYLLKNFTQFCDI